MTKENEFKAFEKAINTALQIAKARRERLILAPPLVIITPPKRDALASF